MKTPPSTTQDPCGWMIIQTVKDSKRTDFTLTTGIFMFIFAGVLVNGPALGAAISAVPGDLEDYRGQGTEMFLSSNALNSHTESGTV